MKLKSATTVFEIDLLTLAEKELEDSYDWYEGHLPSLGTKFYNEINYYLSLLENNPYQFAIKYNEDLRAASLNKFPFLIIYWIDEMNRKVFVVSIFHTSRNPRYF